MSRPDAAERPDWASGSEWEGWEMREATYGLRAYRTVEPLGFEFEIERDGFLHMGRSLTKFSFRFPDPAAALRVANVIAAELGGWES